MSEKQEKPINYFEGILQLREVSKDVFDYVEEECLNEHPRMVAKVLQVRGGYDLYLQNNKFLTKLGKRIQTRFCGELLKTASLHTRDTQKNKDLYRLTVLFRQHEYGKGDTILFQGEEYLIVSAEGKVHLKNNKTGKKMITTYKKLKDYKARKVEC